MRREDFAPVRWGEPLTRVTHELDVRACQLGTQVRQLGCLPMDGIVVLEVGLEEVEGLLQV
ncbi:hypothetical protein ACFV90_33810 [Streptomyces sp. NPDC059904]|uniref:hypothetical protein n=1 Tax=Streptomyces sp. NPDC059904 TaxID=3346996 RepID=UPI00365A6643